MLLFSWEIKVLGIMIDIFLGSLSFLRNFLPRNNRNFIFILLNTGVFIFFLGIDVLICIFLTGLFLSLGHRIDALHGFGLLYGIMLDLIWYNLFIWGGNDSGRFFVCWKPRVFVWSMLILLTWLIKFLDLNLNWRSTLIFFNMTIDRSIDDSWISLDLLSFRRY